MELPVINFEAGINSLSNPSLISRLLSVFELGKLSPTHRIWKWGAVFLAFVYAFSSLVNKIKIIILYYHNKSRSLLSEPLLSHLNNEFDSDDDEYDDVCSTSESSSDEEEEDEAEDTIDSSYDDLSRFEDDCNVKGSFRNFSESPRQKRKFKLLRRRRSIVDNFSLSDLVNGNGVVKLWDGLGLGVLDVEDSFSFLDFNNIKKTNLFNSSIFAGIPEISSSPAVFLTSGSGDEKLGLDIWDLRTGGRSPAVHAEWLSDRQGKFVGVNACRSGEAYVRDNISSRLTVGDLRKVDTPFAEELTESEEDMWWDADGVSATDESTHEFAE